MMWTNTPAEEAPVPDDYNVIKLYKILMMAVTNDHEYDTDDDGYGENGDDGSADDGDDDGVDEYQHLRPSELGQPDTILVWLAAGA